MLGRRRIVGIDPNGRLGKRIVSIPLFRVRPALGLVCLSGRARRTEGRARWFLEICDLDLVGGFPRCFIGFGDDDTDDLAVVPDPGVLERGGGGAAVRAAWRIEAAAHIFVREDIDDPGNTARAVELERVDAATRDRAGDQVGKRRIGHLFIGGIASGARHFGNTVDPLHRLSELTGEFICHCLKPPRP